MVDLAVAVVVGTAFSNVVNALVRDFITPLIAAIGGKPDFGALKFEINNSTFAYGDFFNTLISFLIISAVIFFLVVQPLNHLMRLANRSNAKGEDKAAKDPQLVVLEEIRDSLRKR